MVIVIPLEATDRLIEIAEAHQLNIPMPLSSGCESYISPEEMEVILQQLSLLSANNQSVMDLIADLQTYTHERRPVTPCDS